ncbi:MAG: hypothetical protein R3B95_10140 [Nitrospirales bacterium]|nr:hypothetical protein [Nitrospirales bacterium]
MHVIDRVFTPAKTLVPCVILIGRSQFLESPHTEHRESWVPPVVAWISQHKARMCGQDTEIPEVSRDQRNTALNIPYLPDFHLALWQNSVGTENPLIVSCSWVSGGNNRMVFASDFQIVEYPL